MSLWTLRTHVWKGGNDIVLHYKANGRKEIIPANPAPVAAEATDVAESVAAGTTAPAPPPAQ